MHGVPGSRTRRGVGRSLAVALATLVGLVALLPSPTHAAATARPASHKSRPVLAPPVVKAAHVVLTGRAQPGVVVRVQAKTDATTQGASPTGWTVVAKVRTKPSGRFRATTAAPVQRQAVRVVAQGRTSPVRTVVPPATTTTGTGSTGTSSTGTGSTGTGSTGTGSTGTSGGTQANDPPAPTDACGAEPLKADGTRWQCTFVDDFNGTALDQRWVASQIPGNGGNLCYASSPQTIAVSDGELRLSVVPTGNGTTCPARADGTRASYAGASISTWHTFGQQYGRFEARMRVPVVNGPGLHSAFWLWPDTRTGSDADWPRTGEIDIAELYSGYPNLVVPFLHYADDALGPVQGLNTTTKATSQRGVWHTYTLTWSADRLDIAVDGTTILSNTAGAATFRKAFILNLSQLLGSGLNAWDGKVALPSSMEVDYVKVWK